MKFNKDLHTLWHSVLRLPFLKEEHLRELEDVYFEGMRKNWFPLILLNLYDILLYANQKEDANEVLEYFKNLCNKSDLYSFYIDDGRFSNNEVGIFFRCNGHYRDLPLLEILRFYNIQGFRVQEIK